MFNWQKEHKHFIDNVEGGTSKEAFFMTLYSGEDPFVCVLTPTHLKKLAQWMAYQVETYEKTYGKV